MSLKWLMQIVNKFFKRPKLKVVNAMDFHFNLRQGPPNKFRMPPFLNNPGFERSFSTKSHSDIGSNREMALQQPMFGLYTDFHADQMPLSKKKNHPKILPMMESFSNASSMSVSCIVGGFLRNEGQPIVNSSQNICNILDVLVSSFQSKNPAEMGKNKTTKEPFPDTLHNYKPPSTEVKLSIGDNFNTTMDIKRTYADVTKGVSKKNNFIKGFSLIPFKFDSIKCGVNISPNSKVTMYTQDTCPFSNSDLSMDKYAEVLSASPGALMAKSLVINGHSSSENSARVLQTIEDIPLSLPLKPQPLMTLPVCPRENCVLNRTLSECSVDSDDSFVVFQNDEETVCDSLTEDECVSDLDEVDRKLPDPLTLTSPIKKKKTKRVTFKSNESLTKVHNLVTWDYAHRAARIGPWETYARDRVRFENRIFHLSQTLNPILEDSHRKAVFRERFMEKS